MAGLVGRDKVIMERKKSISRTANINIYIQVGLCPAFWSLNPYFILCISVWKRVSTFGLNSGYFWTWFAIRIFGIFRTQCFLVLEPEPSTHCARRPLRSVSQSAHSDSPQTARASPTPPGLGACRVSGSAGARALVGYGRAWQHLEFSFCSPKVENSKKTRSRKRGAPGAPDQTSQIGPSLKSDHRTFDPVDR